MKTARTHKFIALITLLVLSLVCALCGISSVSADTTVTTTFNASSYFVYSAGNQLATGITAEDDSVAVLLNTTDKIKVKNKLAIDDFEMQVTVPNGSGVEELCLSLTAGSFDVNGNKAEKDGKTVYNKDVVNEVKIDMTALTASANGGTATPITITDGVITFGVKMENNFAVFTVNGTAVDYAKIDALKLANNNKTLAVVELSAVLPAGTENPAKVYINYLDQKASYANENYKQTFVLKADGSAVETQAYPVITLNEGFMKTDASGNVIAPTGKENVITITQNSVLTTSKAVKIICDDTNCWIANGANYFVLKKANNDDESYTIKIVDKADETIVYETYNVEAVSEGEDGNGTAPEYNGDVNAIEAFRAEIQEKIVDAYDENGNPIYVRLGSTEYLELPSLKSMISDDISAYEDLSFTLYYQTPTGEQSTSGLRIPLATAGQYSFYILAKDERGNAMTTDDFYSTDVNGEKVFDGQYASQYKFSFTILDNAPISVTPAKSQGNGFIGVTYAATGFTIKASSYEVEYKLLYSENKTAAADKWIEIPKASDIADTDYDKNGFNYDAIKAINYDGNLSFTPDRAGYYKIVCTVTSKTSSRVTETAETTAISIQEKPQVVVAKENDWLANNVWSVVFLSVGTACLIAIVVLLCIKPKEVAAPSTPVRAKTRSKRRK